MNERKTQWTYNMVETSEDKSRPRVSTRPDKAYEIIGADGNFDGGLRPISGFTKLAELDYQTTETVSSIYRFTSVSTVEDFFPVTFRIQKETGGTLNDGYGYGYVYRVKEGGKTTSVFIEYYDSLADKWTSFVGSGIPGMTDASKRVAKLANAGDANNTCLLTARFTDTTKQMSVSVQGRFIYLFCEGQSPVVFYVSLAGEPTTVGALTTDPKPGAAKPPQLHTQFHRVGASATDENPSDKRVTVLYDIGARTYTAAGSGAVAIGNGLVITTITGEPKYPGIARICGVQVGVANPPTDINTIATINYGNGIGDEAATGGAYFKTGNDSDSNAYPAATINDDAHVFEKGDYAFAYYLYNSETGRRTPLSTVCECKSENFGTLDMRVCLDIRYNSDLYDQAYVYRSVRCQDAGGAYIAGILHLDAIIDLSHWQVNNANTDDQEADTGVRTAVYWYRLNDTALVYQNIYLDKTIHDEFMPFGGSSHYYEGTMLVSKVLDSPRSLTGKISTGTPSDGMENRVGDKDRGLGETRWSSLYEASPELFPPVNRYVPPTPTNEILSFLPVGPLVFGLSRDRVYYVLKDGAFLRMQEAHRGYGVVNHRAGDTVGPMAYYVTTRGVKALHPSTQVDDVSALDKLIVEDWRDDHSKIKVAYDPTQLCLYIHNPTQEQTAVMWFNTGRVTEIHDTNFDHCERGTWSSDPTDPTADIEERVLWLMNNPDTTNNTTFKPTVFLMDNTRKTNVSGYPVVRTIQHSSSSSHHKVTETNGTSYYLQLEGLTGISSDMVGGYAYLMKEGGSTTTSTTLNPSNAGQKFKITKVDTNSLAPKLYMSSTDWNAFNWSQASRICISPVFFRYTGPPVTSAVPTPDRPYGGNNLFRIKQISSIGAVFSNVSYEGQTTSSGAVSIGGAEGNAYWKGLVFLGEETTAKTSAIPVDRDLDVVTSIEEGEPDNWAAFDDPDETTFKGKHGVRGFSLAPALEIFSADVDYRLLQVQVKGTLTASHNAEIGT